MRHRYEVAEAVLEEKPNWRWTDVEDAPWDYIETILYKRAARLHYESQKAKRDARRASRAKEAEKEGKS